MDAIRACSLSATDLTSRLAEIASLNAGSLQSARRSGNSIELTYDDGASPAVESLIERERTCCAPLTFTVRQEGRSRVVTIDFPPSLIGDADAVFAAFSAGKDVTTDCGSSGCCG